MESNDDRLLNLMECKCGRQFSYEALFSTEEINFCSKCGRKKPKYLNEEFAKKHMDTKMCIKIFTSIEAKINKELFKVN